MNIKSIQFIRMIRTVSSEVYAIINPDEEIIGRIDLHFLADGTVSCSVICDSKYQLSGENELEICQRIDDEIVHDKTLDDDDFNITFAQAELINIYGNQDN